MTTRADWKGAWRETLAEHQALLLTADRLRIVSRPREGVVTDERLRLLLEGDLRSFAARLYAHFGSEESGSYLGIQQHPELAGRLEHLKAQHGQLRLALDALIAEISSAPLAGDFGERVAGFLDDLARHERAEDEIVQECLLRDTGRGD